MTSKKALKVLCLVFLAVAASSRVLTEENPVNNVEATQSITDDKANHGAEEIVPADSNHETPRGNHKSFQRAPSEIRSNLLKTDHGLTDEEKSDSRRWWYIRYGVVGVVLLTCFLSFMAGREKSPMI